MLLIIIFVVNKICLEVWNIGDMFIENYSNKEIRLISFFHFSLIQIFHNALITMFSPNLLKDCKSIDKFIHLGGFPGGSDCKESASSTGDLGSVPGLVKSPGEKKDYPLQYSCLENSVDRGTWWAAVHGVAQSRTRLKQLSMAFLLDELWWYMTLKEFVLSV